MAHSSFVNELRIRSLYLLLELRGEKTELKKKKKKKKKKTSSKNFFALIFSSTLTLSLDL